MPKNPQGKTGCLMFLILFAIVDGIATVKVFTGDYGIGVKLACGFVMFFLLSAILGYAKVMGIFSGLFGRVTGEEARRQWVMEGNPVPAIDCGILSEEDIAKELQKLKGRRIDITYERRVDGADTAADLVAQTLRQVGAEPVDTYAAAEVAVYIKAGKALPYRFSIDDPPDVDHPTEDNPLRMERECGAKALTVSILLGICFYLKRKGEQTPQCGV